MYPRSYPICHTSPLSSCPYKCPVPPSHTSTPDVLIQYHTSSLGILFYTFSKSTKHYATPTDLLHTSLSASVLLFLSMKIYCCSLIITSHLNLASTTLSHTLVFMIHIFDLAKVDVLPDTTLPIYLGLGSPLGVH